VDQASEFLLLIASVGIVALSVVVIMGRQRRERQAATRESPYAVSTEGEKRCPNCGMGNLWTENRCIACKAPLRG
jgi:cytochrome c-type biogenesis protein CcmH/NrfF